MDKTLVNMFNNGSPMEEGQFLYLVDRGLLEKGDYVNLVIYELTKKGKELLNET